MKKVLLFLLMIVMMNIPVKGETCYAGYTEPAIEYNIQKSEVIIKFPSGEINDVVFCNGRLGVPLAEGVKAMGGNIESTFRGYNISIGDESISLGSAVSSNRPVIFTYNNKEYISLYELITPFGYEEIPDINKNTVDILKYKCDSNEIFSVKDTGSKEAYIRLEDIAADGSKPGGGGNYTVDMLEKLKYMAEYLYNRDQEYYIAWVPVYAYPEGNYWNDVSKDFNLYNSYFLYVLDYMVDHNGHLGLHGYTHQYGYEESCIGYEWGKNTPYNTNEQQRRMIAAKETCHKLGYNEEFFEFPHYGATNEQLLMAEYYFDAVYQPYPDEEHYNYLTYTDRSGKIVHYIPTPADYVHYKNDNSIFDKIKNAVTKGYTLSLYFHPVIDEEQIRVETKENERVWVYSEEGTLPEIINYVTELGYGFSDFRQNRR